MSELLIFDLGYNHGNITRQMLCFYPEARIIGVEGHPMYHDLFRASPISNVELIQAVVSDEDGKDVPFYICDSNPGINSINPEWITAIRHRNFFERTKRMVLVKSITIDGMISRYGVPDIIKMDIEGAESKALRGLSRKCGLVTFEWSEDFFGDSEICVDLLKKLGYEKFAFTEESDQFNPNLDFDAWENLKLKDDIDPKREKRWGMIYAK